MVGEEPAEAIIRIADPFHDVKLEPTPLPTEDGERVVALTLSHTKTFSAPPGTAGNWSCAIFTTPADVLDLPYLARGVNNGEYAYSVNVGSGLHVHNVGAQHGYQTTGGQLSVGPVAVWSFATDAYDFFPGPETNFTQVPAAHWADTVLSNADSSVSYRVTGSGFEIHNTTSDLYKQGTITVVRTTNRKLVGRNIVAGSWTSTGVDYPLLQQHGGKVAVLGSTPVSDYDIFQLPPANIQDALLQGARQWEAADGCMCVSVVDNKHNQFTSFAPACYALDTNMFSNPAIDSNPDDGVLGTNVLTALVSEPYHGELLSISGGTYSNIVYPNLQTFQHFTPRDINCVYLTGLSQQTTFTLTTKYQVEMKPRIFDTAYSITVPMLASPPKYSLKSELVGSHLMHALPPGVPVGMNPSGEAWADLVSGLGNLAGMVGPLFGPTGATAGAVASMAAKAVSGLLRESSAKKSRASSAPSKQAAPQKSVSVKGKISKRK